MAERTAAAAGRGGTAAGAATCARERAAVVRVSFKQTPFVRHVKRRNVPMLEHRYSRLCCRNGRAGTHCTDNRNDRRTAYTGDLSILPGFKQTPVEMVGLVPIAQTTGMIGGQHTLET
jgi:hypothetical protein